MATKTSQKKTATAPKTTSASPAANSRLAQIADEFLMQRVYQAIVAHGEPAKIADIVRTIDDDAIGLGLVRHAISSHPHHFLSVDRRWDISTRYLDRQRPALKTLEEIVANYGEPMAAWEASHELAAVLNRSGEGTLPTVDKLFRYSGTFFTAGTPQDVRYGLTSWLLTKEDQYTDADLLFYNYLPADAPNPYVGLSLDWENHPEQSALDVLAATPESPAIVDNRLLMFLAYKALEDDFDGPAIYSALIGSGQLIALPRHRWTNRPDWRRFAVTSRRFRNPSPSSRPKRRKALWTKRRRLSSKTKISRRSIAC